MSTQPGLTGAGASCINSPTALTAPYTRVINATGGATLKASAALLVTGAQWQVFNVSGKPIMVCADAAHNFQNVAGGVGSNNMTSVLSGTAATFTVVSPTVIMQTNVAQ